MSIFDNIVDEVSQAIIYMGPDYVRINSLVYIKNYMDSTKELIQRDDLSDTEKIAQLKKIIAQKGKQVKSMERKKIIIIAAAALIAASYEGRN